MKRFAFLFAVIAGLLAACGKEEPPPGSRSSAEPVHVDALFPIERVTRGAALYQQYCAECHGPEAQGHPDWENPEVAVAPPLNGTGREWKRTRAELFAVVKNGANRNGKPVMPPWKDRLSDQEIGDIVVWFQALWPVEVYKTWLKANGGPGAQAG